MRLRPAPETNQLLRSTGVVGGLTLISRVLGFFRDLVIAGSFGANAGTDAFFVAFKIPNFLRRLFSEGAFAQAFVPVLSSIRETEGEDSAVDFMSRMCGSFAVILGVVSGIGMIGAPLVVWLFAPGFHSQPAQYELTVDLLRVTFPYLFFISLTALAGGVLNTWNRFAIPAFTPVLLNLCMIMAAVELAPRFDEPIKALGWGVFLAGILQLSIQLPALRQLGVLSLPRIDFDHPAVRRVFRLMVPAIFGASVNQLNLLINTLIASLLATGSISWLYYSDRLVEFPLGIFGAGIGTVILPHLSRSQSRRDLQGFSDSLDWAIRWLSLIGLPASFALIILAEPLMLTLFQHDQFTVADAHMASGSLMAYGFGLTGFLGVKILVPGFSAREDLKTPAMYGTYAVLINLLLSTIIAWLLAPSGWGHAGLALAASVSSLLNSGLLLHRLIKLQVYRPNTGHGLFMVRVLLSSITMSTLLLIILNHLSWPGLSSAERVIQLAMCTAAGLTIYVAALVLTGLRPRHLILSGRP